MVSLSRAVRSASLLIVVSSAASAFGQVTINEATLFWIADQGANGQYAEMRFSQPLTAAPTADQIHITMKPSGRVLRLSSPRRGIGQPDLLVINWTSEVLPSEDDTSFSVTIDRASFSGPSAVVQNMQKEGEFYTRGNVQKYYDARKKAFDDAIAVAKTSQEKDIFAGLSVAAPTNGNAEGDADISLNRWLTQNLYVSIILNM